MPAKTPVAGTDPATIRNEEMAFYLQTLTLTYALGRISVAAFSADWAFLRRFPSAVHCPAR
jgi:hypothetical protein